MKTVKSRIDYAQEKAKPVYRTPWQVSEEAYQAFNQLAHRARLSEGTSVFAHRLIREESFNKEELRELRDLMTDEAPETELSAQILGGKQTLAWLDSVLNPGSKV